MKIGDMVWVEGKMAWLAGQQPASDDHVRHYGQILAIRNGELIVVLESLFYRDEWGEKHHALVQVAARQCKKKEAKHA